VYLITNLKTDQKYIGRKLFNSTSRKPVKGSVRRKKVVKESSWKNYYGSSLEMKQMYLTYGPESFKREIIHLCKSKSTMSYQETKEILIRDALLRDDYVNKWLTAQINGRNLLELKDKLYGSKNSESID
jgi:hypothetical protein